MRRRTSARSRDETVFGRRRDFGQHPLDLVEQLAERRRRRCLRRSADTAGCRPPAARRARVRSTMSALGARRRRSPARPAPSAIDRDARRHPRAGSARESVRPLPPPQPRLGAAGGGRQRASGEERADHEHDHRGSQRQRRRRDQQPRHPAAPRRLEVGSSRAHTVRSNAAAVRPTPALVDRRRAPAAAARIRPRHPPHSARCAGRLPLVAAATSRRSSAEPGRRRSGAGWP